MFNVQNIAIQRENVTNNIAEADFVTRIRESVKELRAKIQENEKNC